MERTATEGTPDDAAWMARALELARRGRGRVEPNPLVGAVLVTAGVAVGEGHHAEYGGPHAEVEALRRAGERARGSTLYVNLEPCAHAGKTPPCTEAILAAGVRRVVAACSDPHAAAGGGAEALRAAGVEVTLGPAREPAARLNAPFLWWHRTGRPFVSLKLALSLDGKIAAAPGRRTRLTGPEAGAFTHRLRASADAVLVGRGTVAVDDPLLTARGEATPRRPAVRVVMDSRLRTPPDSALLRSADQAPVWLLSAAESDAVRRSELEDAGARIFEIPEISPGRLSVPAALERLRELGVRNVLLEGGARLGRSFLEAGVVQRLYLLVAPVLLGEEGVAGFPGAAPGSDPGWRLVACERLGDDALLRLEREELLGALLGEPAEGGLPEGH